MFGIPWYQFVFVSLCNNIKPTTANYLPLSRTISNLPIICLLPFRIYLLEFARSIFLTVLCTTIRKCCYSVHRTKCRE